MNLSISRWRAGNLFAAWATYWAGLAVVTLTPTALAILRATSGSHDPSSVSASLGDKALSITATEAGRQTFIASAHPLPVVLWIAVPPLALFGLWLWKRSRALGASPRPEVPAALGAPTPDFAPPPARDPVASNVHPRTPHA